MAEPTTGTCEPWATLADLCSPCDDYEIDEALLEDSLQIASDLLFLLSDRKYPGLCTDVVRPIEGGCGGRTVWTRGARSRDRTADPCRRTVPGIRLGGTPLVSIEEVRLDGEVLDPSEYQIDDHDRLVRLRDADGVRRQWPCCQDTTLPATEDGTFQVSYTYGRTPPLAGIRAAASLGCQLTLACQPETIGSCRLSDNTISVTRQGVTKQLRDPATMFPEGRTGLNEVDLWLEAERYARRRPRPALIVPETAARRIRRTNT
jgi:hypothetical protein